jgi:hypothetical protein
VAKLLLFLEDIGQEAFISEVALRVAKEESVDIQIEVRNATGGLGRALTEFKRFLADLQNKGRNSTDILLVAIDGNSQGWKERKKEITSIAGSFTGYLVCAIPEPHIEKWYLIDSEALRKALQQPVRVDIPQKNREKDFYKRLLAKAFREAGLAGTLPSAYACDIVRNIDFYRAGQVDRSFLGFLTELRQAYQQYRLHHKIT